MNELSSSWHSYPKIYNLGHPAIKHLFDDEVIIEEKIDGSQFSFGKFDGELKIRSKGVQMVVDAPEKMFNLAVQTVLELKNKLIDGWTYRAEFLKNTQHNCLKYSRVPEKHLMIFDINTGYETYLDYHEKKMAASGMGLEVAPILFQGKIESLNFFKDILSRDSVLGGEKLEGVVIKNYSKFTADAKVMMGKHVSESFKETNKASWKNQNPSQGDVLQILCSKYKNPVRWQKAVFRLRDEGKLTNSPQDIGMLINTIRDDVRAECADEIKEILFKWGFPDIQRASSAGFPEWYKEQLLQSQFEKEM